MQESYIMLLKLLIDSVSRYSNINPRTTDILIITSSKFQSLIQAALVEYPLPIHYYIIDTIESLFDTGCARLNIFQYIYIEKYEKILYLDTDVLINNDINVLFNLNIASDKLYALEEGTIGNPAGYWGLQFFDFSNYDITISGFSSGVLFFCNSIEMKSLFNDIQCHIQSHISNNQPLTACLDQPFIVYNAIIQDKYDTQLMKQYLENNPTAPTSEMILYHFPGGPGNYSSKYYKMTACLNTMNRNFQNVDKVNIIHYGTDGFGHQLEGTLRLVSLSLNNKARYNYKYTRSYSFDHMNYTFDKLKRYLTDAMSILSENEKDCSTVVNYQETNNNNVFKTIIDIDSNYKNNIYLYDGVGFGHGLPPNFEFNYDMEKSLDKLRNAYVLKNTILPPPTYDTKYKNVCVHVRLGDATTTRILDYKRIFKVIKYFQSRKDEYRVTIHSDGNINVLNAENTILHDHTTDVLQVFSDFIHADILIITYSSLSIAAHLLADRNQVVICPVDAGVTFHDRILQKCINCDDFLSTNLR